MISVSGFFTGSGSQKPLGLRTLMGLIDFVELVIRIHHFNAVFYPSGGTKEFPGKWDEFSPEFLSSSRYCNQLLT